MERIDKLLWFAPPPKKNSELYPPLCTYIHRRSDIHKNIFWINIFNFDINEHEVISFHSYKLTLALAGGGVDATPPP